jgi:hypothetical protein
MSAYRPLLALGTLAAGGVVLVTTGAPLTATGAAASRASRVQALAAFDTVKTVLQNPRCQNCHIPGDAPLQLDDGQEHIQNVQRGPDGSGAPGLPCSTCHAAANPPASYGAHMPPGAPAWKLPPPDRKMVFINLSKADLCATLKDPKRNGGRDAAALLEHVSHDKLVLWGWDPGVGRSPVPIPHAEFVRSVQTWIDGGMPCPATSVAASLPGKAR